MSDEPAQDALAPMRELDEKVREFTRTALDREGVVTGWVLMVGTARFDDNGDPVYGYDYAAGLDTPIPTAVGLVELGRRAMYRDAGCDRRSDEQDD